ncbi:FGGY family carbohydrate kinase [Fervidobacterium pennivorans subsp. shakshaketiis]|uniref:Pentulose/hexulose kinase n=2 Tax=Fervidobacterium TaxID=2422 RepID=H9U9U9_FERPD|nr:MULTISPECIES: FGGY family carbohydrate kinase [Fervidobacterium]AFG34292.1 pentulose/hexulose kinase [Fervidobacterium pennivorans DSM 9078]AMW32017.1 FGGY family carbohydrate kinase [Fervidobacterium islandicum]
MKRYYIGVDVGTSSTKAVVFDEEALEVRYKAVENYAYSFDEKIGITIRPKDIEAALERCLRDAANFLRELSSDRKEIYLVVDTMLHSLLFLDSDMKPVANIIPWTNDLGTTEAIKILKNESVATLLHSRTGCPVAPTYPFYKLIWFSKNEQDFLKQVTKIASVKDYIIHLLTDSHFVDKSIASGSGCYDIRADRWADDLLRDFAKVDSSKFPSAVSGNTVLKPSKFLTSLFDEKNFDLRVIVGTSDGAASSMGTTFGDSSLITISMGTSAAIRRITSKIPDVEDMPGFGPWCYIFDDNNYIVGSATNNCGNVLNWWKDNYLKSSDYTPYEQTLNRILNDEARIQKPNNYRVLFKPTVFGMRSIRWIPYQKGEFYNLSPHTSVDDLTAAVIEGLVFKFRRAVNVVEEVTRKLLGDVTGFVASGGLLEIPGFGNLLSTVLNRGIFYRSNRYDAVLGTVLFALRLVNKAQFEKFVNTNKETKIISPTLKFVGFYEGLYQAWTEKIEESEKRTLDEILKS